MNATEVKAIVLPRLFSGRYSPCLTRHFYLSSLGRIEALDEDTHDSEVMGGILFTLSESWGALQVEVSGGARRSRHRANKPTRPDPDPGSLEVALKWRPDGDSACRFTPDPDDTTPEWHYTGEPAHKNAQVDLRRAATRSLVSSSALAKANRPALAGHGVQHAFQPRHHRSR